MIDKWYSTLPIFIDIFGKWSDLWLNSQEKPSFLFQLDLYFNIMPEHYACCMHETETLCMKHASNIDIMHKHYA